MIKSFHVATPSLHCPAQNPNLRRQMGRTIQDRMRLPPQVQPDTLTPFRVRLFFMNDKSKGGSDLIINIVPSCNKFNSKKGVKIGQN